MNILREIRRIKQKNMPIRIISILLFSLILIINTFAWFTAQKDITLGGLEGDVTSWDVSYYINNEANETLDQTVTLTVNEFYPGMPEREDKVYIYNMGKSSTNIQYELVSVKVFGQEVLSQLQADGEIVTDTNTRTTTIFAKDGTYPFNISYTYDTAHLNGNENPLDYISESGYIKNVEKDGELVSPPYATFRYLVTWDYDVENGTEAENSAKDILDTKFGKDAYAYYQDEENDPNKAIEIKVKITSNFVHPSLETE